MDKQEAIESLKKAAPKGAIIISTTKEVSSDSMTRVITFAVAKVDDDGQAHVQDITGRVAIITEHRRKETRLGEGISIRGLGYNVPLDITQQLGRYVWDDDEAYTNFHL